jgi:hypothetical protein
MGLRGTGGDARKGRIGRTVRLVEGGVLALVLTSCGSADPAPQVASTPAPVQTAAQPPATVVPTPTPKPTASALAEPDGGDETPIGVPVRVRVTEGRTLASKRVVPAFLPLRFTVTNQIARAIEVVVIRSGAGGGPVGRASLKAGGRGVIRVKGLKPGSLEISSPDLDPDQTAIIAVKAGA